MIVKHGSVHLEEYFLVSTDIYTVTNFHYLWGERGPKENSAKFIKRNENDKSESIIYLCLSLELYGLNIL